VTKYCSKSGSGGTHEMGGGKVKVGSGLQFQLLCSPVPRVEEYGIADGDGTSSSSSIVTVIQKDEFQIYMDDGGYNNDDGQSSSRRTFEDIQTMNKRMLPPLLYPPMDEI